MAVQNIYIPFNKSILIKKNILEIIKSISLIIFDVDGVLIDVSNSFRKTIIDTIDFYFSKILLWKNAKNILSPSDIEKFKMAGGFNDDWDISFCAALFYIYKGIKYKDFNLKNLKKIKPKIIEFTEKIANNGGGLDVAEKIIFEDRKLNTAKIISLWDKKIIKRIFQEIYAGEKYIKQTYNEKPIFNKSDGLHNNEKILLDTSLLNKKYIYGIITGRTRGELNLAFNKMKIKKIFKSKFIITQDDGVKKPDPECLIKIMNNIREENGIYIGDTIDDLSLVENYKKKTGRNFLSCIVSEKNKIFFKERNTDIIVDNINIFLKFMNNLRRSYEI